LGCELGADDRFVGATAADETMDARIIVDVCHAGGAWTAAD